MKPWRLSLSRRWIRIANGPLTPSLSPSEGERVPEGRVRGPFRGSMRESVREILSINHCFVAQAFSLPYRFWINQSARLQSEFIQVSIQPLTDRFSSCGPGNPFASPDFTESRSAMQNPAGIVVRNN